LVAAAALVLVGNGMVAQALPPASGISISDVTVQEGDAGTVDAVFTVSVNKPPGLATTVSYRTQAGSATAGVDYQTTTGQVTIGRHQSSATIIVPIAGDTVEESDETFTVELSNPTKISLVDATGVGTIVDDDDAPPPPVIGVEDISVVEDSGDPLVFTVTRPYDPGYDCTVQWGRAGSSIDPEDFSGPEDGTLTFTGGSLAEPITFTVTPDTIVEPEEHFDLVFFNASGCTVIDEVGGSTTASATVIDDDVYTGPPPIVSIGDAGDHLESFGGTVDFVVSRSAATTYATTVEYTVTGTATGGSDYEPDYVVTSGTLTIPAYYATADLTFRVLPDSLPEGDETIVVTISNPSDGTLGQTTGTGTIIDDDLAG
jgi:chitinase